MATLTAAGAVAQGGSGSSPAAVFHDRLELTRVELQVTVFDPRGEPVEGLGASDFVVLEDGREVDLLRVEAPGHGSLATPSSGVVVVLFDETSLGRRSRRQVLEALEPFLEQCIARGDRVILGHCGESLQLGGPPATTRDGLTAMVAALAEVDGWGDELRGHKRMLRRSILSSQAYRMLDNSPRCANQSSTAGGGRGSSTATPAVDLGLLDVNFGLAQAQDYLAQVESLSRNEQARLRHVMARGEELVAAVGGLAGPRSLLLVGEDLVMHPGLDLYSDYCARFRPWQGQVGFEEPELWAGKNSLRADYERLATAAQAAGVVLNVLDASHQDRQASRTDFNTNNRSAVLFPEIGSLSAVAGTGVGESTDLAMAGELLSSLTGGSSWGGTANYDKYFERLGEQWRGVYLLAYQREGAPDGELHPVEVRTARDGLELSYRRRVVHPTVEQGVAQAVLARIQLDAGSNPLELQLQAQPPATDSGQDGVRRLELSLPARSLVLAGDDGVRRGGVSVVVVARRADGSLSPPHLVERSFELASDRIGPDTLLRFSLDVRTDDATERLAVAVRDQIAGTLSTAALSL